MTRATQGERLATVEQRIVDHESRCEERLAEIKAVCAATRQTVTELRNFVVGLIVAVCGGTLLILVSVVLRGAGLAS